MWGQFQIEFINYFSRTLTVQLESFNYLHLESIEHARFSFSYLYSTDFQ